MIIERTNFSNGWRWVTLEELCRDISDGSHFTPTYVMEGVPFLSVKDVRESGISFSDCRFISAEEHKKLCKRCKPEKGDVLYTKVGTTGIAKAIDVEREFSIFVSVALLKLNSSVIPQYLEKVLNAPICRFQAADLTQGAANRNLVIQDIKRIIIPLPPLAEQKRIAAILEKCDRLRRTRRYALQLSDTFLQSVFLEMLGDPATNPMGWDISSLDEVINDTKNGISRRRKTFDNVGNIVLRIKDVGWGIIDYSESNRIDLSEEEINTYCLCNNDLLLVRVNGNPDLVGRAAIFKQINESVAFNDHIIRIKLNHKIVSPSYVVYLLNSPYGRHQIRACVTTTAGQFTINRTGISTILIPVPPLSLQQKFAQIAQKFERLRTQQREAERQAEHLFQTLLHRAFRGELTSSDFDDEAVSALSKEFDVKQPKPKSTVEVAEYLRTKVNQQETEAVQLTLPGLE